MSELQSLFPTAIKFDFANEFITMNFAKDLRKEKKGAPNENELELLAKVNIPAKGFESLISVMQEVYSQYEAMINDSKKEEGISDT